MQCMSKHSINEKAITWDDNIQLKLYDDSSHLSPPSSSHLSYAHCWHSLSHQPSKKEFYDWNIFRRENIFHTNSDLFIIRGKKEGGGEDRRWDDGERAEKGSQVKQETFDKKFTRMKFSSWLRKVNLIKISKKRKKWERKSFFFSQCTRETVWSLNLKFAVKL